jgi:hypothetical protein
VSSQFRGVRCGVVWGSGPVVPLCGALVAPSARRGSCCAAGSVGTEGVRAGWCLDAPGVVRARLREGGSLRWLVVRAHPRGRGGPVGGRYASVNRPTSVGPGTPRAGGPVGGRSASANRPTALRMPWQYEGGPVERDHIALKRPTPAQALADDRPRREVPTPLTPRCRRITQRATASAAHCSPRRLRRPAHHAARHDQRLALNASHARTTRVETHTSGSHRTTS